MSSKLFHIKRDIERKYFSISNTAERYEILKELEDHIAELRRKTIEQIDSGFDKKRNDALCKIHVILSNQCGCTVSTVAERVAENSVLDSVIENLGLDSLDMVEFIMAVEEEFDVEISDEEAEDFKTIGDIISNVIIR